MVCYVEYRYLAQKISRTPRVIMFSLLLRSFGSGTRRSLNRKATHPTPNPKNPGDERSSTILGAIESTSLTANLNTNSRIEEMEKIMARIHQLQSTGSLADILLLVDAMQLASASHFRTPLRDLASAAVSQLSRKSREVQPEFIDEIIKILTLTGRGMIYFQELFDYLVAQRGRLNSSQLATLVYECGRHGLRTKHYLDILVKTPPEQVKNMAPKDASRALKGVCRFAGEYKDFVKLVSGRLDYSKLTPEDVMVLLRALRQTDDNTDFVSLVLRTDWSRFNNIDAMNGVYLLKRTRNVKMDRKELGIVSSTSKQLVSTLSGLGLDNATVTDVSDCLDGMASWKIRDDKLLEEMMNFLTVRAAEIKYSPICGLWQAITDSCGHLQYFHGPWMRIVEEQASSEFNLKKFATFQLVFFLSSLGRLNFFSPKVFEAVASVVASDISSIRDMDMLATLLFPFERVKTCGDWSELADAVAKQAAHLTKSAKRDKLSQRDFVRSIVIVAHSCISLGVDSADSRISSLLKTIEPHLNNMWSQFGASDRFRVRRLAVMGLINVPSLPNVSAQDCDTEVPMFTWKHPDDHKSFELVPVSQHSE
jgi:hypothetical protein